MRDPHAGDHSSLYPGFPKLASVTTYNPAE